ncbi:hypothetical protein GIB67_008686 [Kingdonia uniflora]|uniref:Uncharacterized protein n=1 Tax=Kingdonia uniflora TaxID=39325 RepID=A0A7J7M519_9MAGN|nr:hypothetical protein GIB67_008686 [Kingdonia uniflora]
MITYKDYVKNQKRVEGCITNRYALDEAILYCMEYIPNGRRGIHKCGRPTFMDDDADKEQPLDKGNVIHLETLNSAKTKILLKLSLLGHVVGKNSTKFMSRLGNLIEENIPPYYPDWPVVPNRFKDIVWHIICEEYVLPEAAKRKLMRSTNNLWRNGKKNTQEKMEVDPTTTKSYSFLVGHTRSDGTFPTALVAEKVFKNDKAKLCGSLPVKADVNKISSLKPITKINPTVGVNDDNTEKGLDSPTSLHLMELVQDISQEFTGSGSFNSDDGDIYG